MKTRIYPCPRCRKSTRYDLKNENRPFCSADCKNADTIAWADENYAMAGEPADPEEVLKAIRDNNEED
jgi:hypothetical protein